MDYLTSNHEFFYQGEVATLQEQLGLEDKFTQIAKTVKEPTVIVCDRGAMDIAAYMDADMWNDITGRVGTSTPELLGRYDAVLHLVSAADGAEEFYTTANNKERSEGLEKARIVDKRVIRAWSGHPHLRVINNHMDFDTKINRVLKEISSTLGLPQPITEERKYIVEVVGDMPQTIDSDIVQTYLVADPDSEVRLRQRIWANGKRVNVHTMKKTVGHNQQVETYKKRKSFIWKGQYFELDTYKRQLDGLIILETKGITDTESVNFPPFLKVVKDITGDANYYNYNLALRH